MQAVIAAGGIIHRAGCAETILLFANHRQFCPSPTGWQRLVTTLRQRAPEKAIIVEADTLDEAKAALRAQPDIVQLDKFAVPDVMALQSFAEEFAPGCRLSLAGGINLTTVEEYAQTGVALLVTSAPYHAPPADIKVKLIPTE